MRRRKLGTKRVSVADCVGELAPACSPVKEGVLTCFPPAAPGWALRSHVVVKGAPATPAQLSPLLSHRRAWQTWLSSYLKSGQQFTGMN